MSEYTEIAELLFNIKEKIGDNDYLQISNILLKANNEHQEYKKLYKETEKLLDIKYNLENRIYKLSQ